MRCRHLLERDTKAPLEGLGTGKRLNDDGVETFVAVAQIVGCPVGWIGRDEARLVTAPMWQGQIREILQVECDPNVGHGIAKGVQVHTLGEPVDKRLEDAMHGLHPIDAMSCSVLSTGAHQFIRLSKAMERISHRNRREVFTRPTNS